MSGLRWRTVVLTFFLCAGTTWAAVDQNWLENVVQGIRNQYEPGDAFSLAVSIPQNQDPNHLHQVFQDDPADIVKQTASEIGVYRGTRVVASAQPGAVLQVLENLQPLITRCRGNFLIIYAEESPCGPRCTANQNDDVTTDVVNDIVRSCDGYAVVFSNVVDIPGLDKNHLAESFKQLQISKLGRGNIFRCYEPAGELFRCTSCSLGGGVTPACIANNQEPDGRDEFLMLPSGNKLPTPKSEDGVDVWSDVGGKARRQCKRRGGCREGRKSSRDRKARRSQNIQRGGNHEKKVKSQKARGGKRRGKGRKS